jgi:hypothetical protein
MISLSSFLLGSSLTSFPCFSFHFFLSFFPPQSNLATQDEQLSLLQEMAQLTEGQRQATTQEAVGTVNDFLADLAKIKDSAGASLA